MKHVFIVNPVAGGQDMSDQLGRLLAVTAQKIGLDKADYVITRTTHKGHGKALAQAYASAGEPVRLYAVGGDGTLNEVLSGAYPYPNAAVGCIPYGSGNDFLRNFGVKEEFLDLADQLQGSEMAIDLFRTQFGVGASICAAGLDAKIAYDIPRFRRMPLCGGEMAYRLSILQNLVGPLGRTLRITLDGETITQDCLLTAVCNGGWYGGGFHAAPECAMDDGLLDVMVAGKLPLPRIARVLPLYQKGKHLRDGQVVPKLRDAIQFRRCKTVMIQVVDDKKLPFIVTLDGECYPTREITVEILPQAARVVLPGKVFARTNVHT